MLLKVKVGFRVQGLGFRVLIFGSFVKVKVPFLIFGFRV